MYHPTLWTCDLRPHVYKNYTEIMYEISAHTILSMISLPVLPVRHHSWGTYLYNICLPRVVAKIKGTHKLDLEARWGDNLRKPMHHKVVAITDTSGSHY